MLLNIASLVIFFLTIIGVSNFDDYLVTIKTRDNFSFQVRDMPDKNNAAELLSLLRNNMLKLFNECLNDKSDYKPFIEKSIIKMKDIVIKENTKYSEHTSYTVNKGDELVVCLRSKKTGQMHDINDISYVIIHEMSHMICPEIGHTQLFGDINKYMLKKAIDIGIYKYKDYSINPIEYCGLDLNVNVLNNK